MRPEKTDAGEILSDYPSSSSCLSISQGHSSLSVYSILFSIIVLCCVIYHLREVDLEDERGFLSFIQLCVWWLGFSLARFSEGNQAYFSRELFVVFICIFVELE